MADPGIVATLVERSAGQERHYPLTEITTIGRSSDNTISFSDARVSFHHAIIRRMPGADYRLDDLRTTNGTFVKGERITSTTLSDGDAIRIGNVELCFTQSAEDKATPPAESGEKMRVTDPLRVVPMTISRTTAAVRPSLERSAVSPDFARAEEVAADQLRKDYENLRAAYELVHAIVGEDDLAVILDRVVDTVIELMSADRAAILVASTTGDLEPRVAKQREATSADFSVSTSILSYVTDKRAAVVCNDLDNDNRFSQSQSLILHSVRSAMCVPMLHEDELVGVIHLDSSLARQFTEEDLEVLTTVANAAASVLKNTLLKEQISEMEQERAAAINAMVSGASHFINNPLAVLRANLSLLGEWAETLTRFHESAKSAPARFAELYAEHGVDFVDEELGPVAKESNDAAGRIGEIVAALRVFNYRQDAGDWAVFDVAEVLGEVLDAQGEQIHAVARSHRQFESAQVRGERSWLGTLFAKIIENAWQAIDGGAPEDNWVVASCYTAGGRVVVAVDDTGHGIPAERRPTIFAPFATHRLDGNLGLGLAIAAEIARQHDARIDAREREGGGTRITIDFPAAR